MKKADIPKPKFGMGDIVIFFMPGEGNYSPRREVGTISRITIRMGEFGNSIRYGFVDREDDYDESLISRRVLAKSKT